MTDIGQRIGDALAEMDAAEERERPEREARQRRLATLKLASPRLVLRRKTWSDLPARYEMIRLSDVAYSKAHVETSYSLDGKPHKRSRPALIYAPRGSGSVAVHPEQLGTVLRRPTAKALARIQEAEEILKLAKAQLEAAKRAAFTYGREIPISAVQKATREYHAAYDGKKDG